MDYKTRQKNQAMAEESILDQSARICRESDRLYECINEGHYWDATAIIAIMKKNLIDIQNNIIHDPKKTKGINLKSHKQN